MKLDEIFNNNVVHLNEYVEFGDNSSLNFVVGNDVNIISNFNDFKIKNKVVDEHYNNLKKIIFTIEDEATQQKYMDMLLNIIYQDDATDNIEEELAILFESFQSLIITYINEFNNKRINSIKNLSVEINNYINGGE